MVQDGPKLFEFYFPNTLILPTLGEKFFNGHFCVFFLHRFGFDWFLQHISKISPSWRKKTISRSKTQIIFESLRAKITLVVTDISMKGFSISIFFTVHFFSQRKTLFFRVFCELGGSTRSSWGRFFVHPNAILCKNIANKSIYRRCLFYHKT